MARAHVDWMHLHASSVCWRCAACAWRLLAPFCPEKHMYLHVPGRRGCYSHCRLVELGTCASVAYAVLGIGCALLPQRGACQGMRQAPEARLHVFAPLALFR